MGGGGGVLSELGFATGIPKMRPPSAAVRPWYMCRSEPQIAGKNVSFIPTRLFTLGAAYQRW